MKNNKYLLSIVFTLTLSAVLMICVLVRLVFPLVILPQWNVPNLVLVSVISLLVSHYIGNRNSQSWLSLFLLASASCALLPWAAGWAIPLQAALYGLSGGIVFTATVWLFASITDRLSSGPAARLAPIMGAVGLYLASQCFQGIFL